MNRPTFTAGVRASTAAALLCALSCVARAQAVETPPSFAAARIEGIAPAGSNYTIADPVRSDGMLRTYVLKTPHGEFTVHGDEMMRMRINELAALAALDQVSESQKFEDALVQAGLNPIKFVGKLVTNPADTVKGTLSGVGATFDRLGAGLSNAGSSPDQPLDSLLGVTDARRALAASYGVDPYTDFPPLDAKLDHLARAATAGGLVVKGALMVVPGAAGIVASNLSTANTLNDVALEDLARNYTAAQILNMNRDRLAAMGVSAQLIDKVLANRNFTPIDMAAMVAALDSMKDVGDRSLFVERAALAQPRFVAYFVRKQAELLAADHRRRHDFVRFVSLDGNPVAVTRKGDFVAIAPIDAMSWTRETAASLSRTIAAARQTAPNKPGVLRMTGQVTPLAERELKREGWTVWQNQFR